MEIRNDAARLGLQHHLLSDYLFVPAFWWVLVAGGWPILVFFFPTAARLIQ